ncbi:MAG: M48 family metallopeptidase [Bdellovibrionales bacterium]|nr:M48 family metallopeptidase [Bdellovibrionales bacterium]
MKKISFQNIFISVKFSNRKTIGIYVHPDKKVEVKAPYKTSLGRIKQLIELKSPWIEKQLKEKYARIEKKREYKNGHTLKLLGQDYLIKVIQVEDFQEEQIIKEKKIIRVYVHDSNKKKRISLFIEEWYRNEALIFLAKKLEKCYQKIKKYNIPRPSFYLRYMKRRWGSCNAKGTILLNPEMIALPSHCIEYIIMHELCHLKHLNHSKEFYHFLETVMPDWEEHNQALDSHLQV